MSDIQEEKYTRTIGLNSIHPTKSILIDKYSEGATEKFLRCTRRNRGIHYAVLQALEQDFNLDLSQVPKHYLEAALLKLKAGEYNSLEQAIEQFKKLELGQYCDLL